MIAYLRGKVILKQAPVIILDVAGVGYEVWVPMSTYYNLPELSPAATTLNSKETELYCYQYIREDNNTLYGFDTLAQRKLFVALLKTNGVGPRLGLTVLSNYQVQEFISIINNNNLNALIRLPGVGKKTAERLLLELKDRIKKIFNTNETEKKQLISGVKHEKLEQGLNQSDNLNANECNVLDAISALESLGYKYSEANRVVTKVLHGVELSSKNNHTSEEIIKAALKEFK